MFLTKSMEKRSCWIGAVPSEQSHVKDQLCIEIFDSVQPRSLVVNFDGGLGNCDPRRLHRRRVANAVSDSVNLLAGRLM